METTHALDIARVTLNPGARLLADSAAAALLGNLLHGLVRSGRVSGEAGLGFGVGLLTVDGGRDAVVDGDE